MVVCERTSVANLCHMLKSAFPKVRTMNVLHGESNRGQASPRTTKKKGPNYECATKRSNMEPANSDNSPIATQCFSVPLSHLKLLSSDRVIRNQARSDRRQHLTQAQRKIGISNLVACLCALPCVHVFPPCTGLQGCSSRLCKLTQTTSGIPTHWVAAIDEGTASCGPS